jgi:ankyrin repeat protein
MSAGSAGGLLLAAAAGGHLGAVQRILLAPGADAALSARNRKGETALQLARAGGHADVAAALLAAGAADDTLAKAA